MNLILLRISTCCFAYQRYFSLWSYKMRTTSQMLPTFTEGYIVPKVSLLNLAYQRLLQTDQGLMLSIEVRIWQLTLEDVRKTPHKPSS